MKIKNTKALFLALLGIGILIVMAIYINNYLSHSKATGDAVSISFSPATAGGAVGQNQTVDLLITSQNSKKISGIDLKLQTQGNVKIVDVAAPAPVSSGDTSFFSQIVKNVSDTSARIAYTASKPEADLPSAVKVTVTLAGTANGTGTLTVDQTKTQVVGTAIGNAFTFGQVDSLQYTVGDNISTAPSPTGPNPTSPGPTAVLGAPIRLSFEPLANTAAVGSKFSTNFRIYSAPAGEKVSAFTVTILFDPNLIEVTGVTDPDPKFTKLNKDIDNKYGTIKLGYFSSLPKDQLPSEVTMEITAQGKSPGNGEFGIAPDVRVAGTIPENGFTPNIQKGTYSITQGATTVTPVVPTTSVTPPVGGNVSLTFKAKFQGITKKPKNSAPINVGIRLAGGSLRAPTAYQTVQFTPSDDGFWSGATSFNVPPGSGYRVYIKGPKHLAKKICDATPTETAPGTYRCSDGHLSLVNGVTTVDASRIVLLAGDLPEQGSTGQNGVVDAFDVSFVRNNLGSTDAKVLSVGDLNLDGIVDSQDFSLILASLSVKYDEE